MKFTLAFWMLICIWSKTTYSNELELEEFQKLFQQKRIEQLTAIKQLLNMSPEKQVKLLDSMLDKMVTVLEESKARLQGSQVEFNDGQLPDNKLDKTYLALVLENTCLASDILLRFPNYMVDKLHKMKNLEEIYHWGLFFVNETVSYVMDDTTKRLFYLAGQELQLQSEDSSYKNPYKKVKNEPKKIMFADPPEQPSHAKKHKKKIKRGPKLTKSEL